MSWHPKPRRSLSVYRGVAVNSAVFRLMGIDDERPETWPSWWLEDPKDFTFEDKSIGRSAPSP